MNKNCYRHIFSKKFAALVAVAETVTSKGASASGEGAANQTSVPRFGRVLAIAAMSLLGGSKAYGQVLPVGGVVTFGAGSIATSGNRMTITQTTNVLGANWNSFSIGASNSVIFNQPSTSSIAVNRVIGNSRSEIYGSLQSNGQVFLLNPNGVMFSKDAQVQVGALVASTKNITDAQLGLGDYTLKGASTAGIINQGTLKAVGNGSSGSGGGYVIMHADRVSNEGTIEVVGGKIVMAAAQTLSLSLSNGQLLSTQVTGNVANALVENKGLIVADDGQVYLTARGKDMLLDTVVNNEGIIRARNLSNHNGVITLDGGDSGVVLSNNGTLDVSAVAQSGDSGLMGGTVVVTGQYIGLFNNSTIDARGDAGGGLVIVGGDNLGKLPASQTIGLADVTVVDSTSRILVNATGTGDAGFIETSGKRVEIQGRVGLSAKNGRGGTWLIDPSDITIGESANVSVLNTAGLWNATASTGSNVNATELGLALSGGGNVTVTTLLSSGVVGQGNITVSGNITKTGGSASNLTLVANGSIKLNGANISSTSGLLNLNLAAAKTNTSIGSVTFNNSVINTNGGNLTVTANTSAGASALVAINVSSSEINATGVGTSLVGFSNSAVAVQFNSGNQTLSGNISGSSNSNAGLQFNDGAQSFSGNISLVGTSKSASGLSFLGGNQNISIATGRTANITGITNNSTDVNVVGLNLSAVSGLNVTNGGGTLMLRG
ncbi:MAG: Two-partner secreted adhesin EtpA, partial [Pseudomonadota bacterium]